MANEELCSLGAGNVQIRAAAHVSEVSQFQTRGTKAAAGKELILSIVASEASDEYGSLASASMCLGPEKSRFHLRCVKYYSRQSRLPVTLEQTAVEVPVWISTASEKTRVHQNWYPFLDSAIAEINQAAPGLHLYKVADEAYAKIRIYRTSKCEAYAINDIKSASTAEIYLGDAFEDKQQTSLHEIYHALGVDHEHQRKDLKYSMKNTNPSSDHNRGVQKTVLPLTRFDPFSVMLYPEGEKLRRREVIDRVWELKPSTTINRVLSELDKVGLNLLYPPCKSSHYNPKKSQVNGMWYCGRHVMASHNTPGENTTDGRCGPDNWANCPACRTLMNPKVDNFVAQGKWQGWSGLVYCGKLFGKQSPGHDGYCGPDNGDPCIECGRILLPGYQGIARVAQSANGNGDCVLL